MSQPDHTPIPHVSPAGRKQFSLAEIYRIIVDGVRTIPFMRAGFKQGFFTKPWNQRIMLSVTEVNGCAICSYEHTKISLQEGMSREEIALLLSGNTDYDDMPGEQTKSVMFAQYYASQRGIIAQDVWQPIVDEYGEQTALAILGSTRAIMAGNALGIPVSSMQIRFKRTGKPATSLGYDVTVLALSPLLLMVGITHALVLRLFGVSPTNTITR